MKKMKTWIEEVTEGEQRSRLKELANIISPVPIKFMADDKMKPNEPGFYYLGGIANALIAKFGFAVKFFPVFYIAKIGDQFNRPHIGIRDSLSYHQKISTLLHEVGHALCYEKNCECCRKNRKHREIHAWEYALSWMLEHELKKALLEALWFILKLSEQDNYHGEASRHIMKTKLWQKCLHKAYIQLTQTQQ